MFAAGADIAELINRDADAALRAINAGLFGRIEAYRWPIMLPMVKRAEAAGGGGAANSYGASHGTRANRPPARAIQRTAVKRSRQLHRP